jgi:CDP-diacylglycerol---glycerol-3-phosphate 3-phosphatidyltransferase
MQGFVERLREFEVIDIPMFRMLEDYNEFYGRIEALLQTSTKVHIASLYFGETRRMLRLMDILEDRKRRSLETYILLDRNRSHAFINSETIRRRNLGSIFHSTDLTGFTVLPSKMNEALRVFHTKALVFDDTVIISGANMDSSYMERRMDR